MFARFRLYFRGSLRVVRAARADKAQVQVARAA